MLKSLKNIRSFFRFGRSTSKVANQLKKPVGWIMSTAGTFFIAKEALSTFVNSTTKYVTEALSGNVSFVVFLVCAGFILLAAIIGKKALKNRFVSFLICTSFLFVIFTTKPIAKRVKYLTNSKESYFMQKYAQKEVKLGDIYDFFSVKNTAQKNAFLCALIKQSKGNKYDLIKAVANDLNGNFKLNKFDKKEVTYHAIVYGDIDLFEFLLSKKAIDCSDEVLYERERMFGFYKYDNLTALELANLEKKSEIANKINELLGVKKISQSM